MQIIVKGDYYHCRHCHKSYWYNGEVIACYGADCCHIGDREVTPKEELKRHKTYKNNLEKQLLK